LDLINATAMILIDWLVQAISRLSVFAYAAEHGSLCIQEPSLFHVAESLLEMVRWPARGRLKIPSNHFLAVQIVGNVEIA